MRWPHFQQDNPADARFCNGCGARLQLTCPFCDHVYPLDARVLTVGVVRRNDPVTLLPVDARTSDGRV